MPGYKNITSVNYEQLELLLQYAVARKSANEAQAFAGGNQSFIDTSENKLRIYDGAGNLEYDSGSAFSSLEYVQKIEWWGSEQSENQYTHKFTYHTSLGLLGTYHIEKVEKVDSDTSTTFIPFIRIGNAVYKITRSYNDLTDVPSTFPPSAHTHTKSDITDFTHTHTKSDITDFTHTHVMTDITDLAFPVTDVKVSTDGTNYSSFFFLISFYGTYI